MYTKFGWTIPFSYPSEDNLLVASAIFNTWCHKQIGTKKKYGFFKTDPTAATFFLSDSPDLDVSSLISMAEELKKLSLLL